MRQCEALSRYFDSYHARSILPDDYLAALRDYTMETWYGGTDEDEIARHVELCEEEFAEEIRQRREDAEFDLAESAYSHEQISRMRGGQ